MSRFERWSRAKRGLPVDDEPPLDGEDANQAHAEQALTEDLDEASVTESGTDAPSPPPEPDSPEPGRLEPDRLEPGSLDATLPDPDTLEEGSDFSAFMSPGVSGALRRKALRRLWSTGDYNVRDGLNDYDQDFKAQLKPMAAEMADKVRQWTHKLEERLDETLEEPNDTPNDRHPPEDADATLVDENPPSSSSVNSSKDDAESTPDER
ncbi:DUF3306 domain-containing protein [Halomonas sp. LS-001]